MDIGRNGQTPLVFVINCNYLAPWEVALKSLIIAYKTGQRLLPSILVISRRDDSDKIRERISFLNDRYNLTIEHREARKCIVHPLKDSSRVRTLYLRLAIQDVLSDYRRCVYLDADILVRRDLHRLTSLDLGNLPVAAVRDPYNPILRGSEVMPGLSHFGLTEESHYFNAGVMVLNLHRLRRDNLYMAAADLVRTHYRKLLWHDQDVLNALYHDQWLPLDPRWNAFPFSVLYGRHHSYAIENIVGVQELKNLERQAWIVHYAIKKPWLAGYPTGEALNEFQYYQRSNPKAI